jgi:hypothetical protein
VGIAHAASGTGNSTWKQLGEFARTRPPWEGNLRHCAHARRQRDRGHPVAQLIPQRGRAIDGPDEDRRPDPSLYAWSGGESRSRL